MTPAAVASAGVAIARITTRQILGKRRLVGLGFLALAPAAIFFLSSASFTDFRAMQQFVDLQVGLLFAVVVPVVTLIQSTATLGEERRGSTMSFLVLRPIPRPVIAAAKLMAAWVTSLLVCGAGAAVMAAALGMRTSDWGMVVPSLVGVGVATLAYSALFVPLGYLMERATLVGLGYVFIWEGPIVGSIGGLAPVSPWRTGVSAFVGLADPQTANRIDSFALGNLDPGAGGAMIKVAILGVVSLVFTTWLFRRRDLT